MSPADAGVGFLTSPSPALTVMASMNWSLQECVPTTKARFVFLISLSTVLCGGNKDAEQLNGLLVGKADLAVHCDLTDPFQTVEVQQALSYQSDKAMTSWAHLLPRQADSDLTRACLFATPYFRQGSFFLHPCLTRDSFAPALSRTLASICFQQSSRLPCLPPSTSAYQQLHLLAFLVGFSDALLHCILLFLFQQRFPSKSGHPLPPRSCSPQLLFSATWLSPPGGPLGQLLTLNS